MEIERVDSKTIRQRVYEQLRHRIIYGELLPGQTVTLRQLAEGFGVSFIPVREALWQLESEKVVVIERNKSIRISTLSANEMKEALSIRLFLETQVARKACETRPEILLPRLRQLVKEMRDAVAAPTEYLMKNSEFHFAIYSCADMPMHLQLIRQVWARIGPYLSFHARQALPIAETIPWHHAMYTAMVQRDQKALVKALTHDLKNAARYITPNLEGS